MSALDKQGVTVLLSLKGAMQKIGQDSGTAAQQLRQEGIQQGRREGMQLVAISDSPSLGCLVYCLLVTISLFATATCLVSDEESEELVMINPVPADSSVVNTCVPCLA